MIFSLHKLKKKKSGQGSLLAICLGSVILSTVILGTTAWYLSMNKIMSGANEKLEAISIAISEWQRLEHMSLDELEDNRENYKTPYNVGDKFKVGVTLGEQGFFDEGKCNSLTGDYAKESANCFKDTIMTVYDADGYALYTTRSLPLSAGSGADNFPEGTILAYTGDLADIPKGWVLCDGNNGTPDLRGRFLEGTGANTGVFKSAGLPNIFGSFTMRQSNYNVMLLNEKGCIAGYPAANSYGSYYNNISGVSTLYGFKIDASLSSSIYGSSETVQPPSYTVFYIMKTNTDFHYNHTNPADTPSFYTKDEIDELLKNGKNEIETSVDSNYLKKSSTEYVRNYSPEYILGLGYDSDDGTIHGYVDNEEKPFAGSGLDVPDYSKEYRIESSWYPWIVPSDGWIRVFAIAISGSGFTITNNNYIVFHYSATGGGCSVTGLIPVRKGDILNLKCHNSNALSYYDYKTSSWNGNFAHDWDYGAYFIPAK